GDLFRLPSVKIGKELDTLDGCHGVARWRAGWWCFATSLACRDRAALKEVERPILESPLDVAPRAVNLLALQGKLPHSSALDVVQTELVHWGRRHLSLESALVGEEADRDAL